MKLSLVPLSDKDAEKLKQAIITLPEFGKLLECIEAEAEYTQHEAVKDTFAKVALHTELTTEDRFVAAKILRLQSAVEVLNEFLEPDYKLSTLDIDK